ncbi:hypothetical protein HETIRDRAFT_173325 [Heterobasidion irregulare TC 32-1]|uniref:Uncharacterized protein n=1 Tax=Heterobasidion irregulare (strain TC 32-1) TaxID=747525 RepID=W4K737_HETIT|nr:uncharacterized protein HETIRDRAFT_173325 [Heterobasidion irregulare TC 32-1]ETW81652.1 hypothetical protein HETIRDRAFT_173325 [Heterobasidion irregulare TC 32-1]
MAGHADNLADGLNEFSHTLLTTARAIQETRSQVAHFEIELRQVRHERDEAIASMHELERRVQDMQSRMESLKAAIVHEAGLVSQARADTERWKEQCVRSGDASRREVEDWKAQWKRAEEERSRLQARLNEFESPITKSGNAPSTPRLDPNVPTASTMVVRSSSASSKYVTSSRATTVTAAKKNRISNATPSAQTPGAKPKPSATPAAPKRTASGAPVKTRVIRHVQAVVDVPIKEENDEQVQVSSSVPGPASSTVQRSRPATGSATTTPRSKKTQPESNRRESESENDDENDESEGESSDDSEEESEYVDNAMARKRRRPSYPVNRRRGLFHDDDDDDDIDELALGVDEDPAEVYRAREIARKVQQLKNNPSTPATRRTGTTTATPSTAQKRKQRPSEAGSVTASARKRR